MTTPSVGRGTTEAPGAAAAGPAVGARVLHAAVALCAAVGVGIEIARALHAPGDTAERLVRLFSYFTIWTNLLAVGVSALLAAQPRRDGPVFRALRLDSVLFVVVTAVTVHLLLRAYVPPDPAGRVADLLTHTVVPVGVVVAWCVAGPRPRLTWWTCLTSLVLPAVWLTWTFAHGRASGWYPYPFLDVGEVGATSATLAALTILVLGALLGVVLRVVERRLPAAPR